SAVHCVQFSVDGQYLAVSCDGEIRISDAKTGTIVCVLAHQTDEKLGVLPFRAMCFTLDGNYLAAGSDDKNIWIWDIAERAIQTSLVGHSKEITSLTTSPDGKLLISGSNDGTVRIWEIQTWNCSVLDIIEPRKMNIGVKSVAVSSDCLWVAAGSMDGVIRIWDIRNKALVERLRGHWEPVSTVNFRGDSPQLISGSWDNALKCWDIGPMVAAPVLIGEEDGVGERGSRCCLSFAEHKDEVLSAVVSPSGDWVASCSTDGAVKIWNPSTAETWLETEGHNGPFTFVALNSVGLLVASGANSHTCICK
ncbi:WD40 repeat-like protein, partial [Clavulina sp. PMI_390]